MNNNEEKLLRSQDIVPANSQFTKVWVDNREVDAIPGESILSLLFAVEQKSITKNDHGKFSGAYCGMGICHCCMVKVGDKFKVKACQTLIEPNMRIDTKCNRLDEVHLATARLKHD